MSGVTCLSRGHRVRLSSEEKFAPTASGLGLPSTLHHDARADADWTSAPRFTVNVMVHIPPFMRCRDCNPRVKSESSGFSTVRPSSSPRSPGSCSRRASPLSRFTAAGITTRETFPRLSLSHSFHPLLKNTEDANSLETSPNPQNQSQRLVEDLIPPCSNPPSRPAASILPPARSQHLLPGRTAAHSQTCARVKPAVRKSNDSEPQNQRRRSDRAVEERRRG